MDKLYRPVYTFLFFNKLKKLAAVSTALIVLIIFPAKIFAQSQLSNLPAQITVIAGSAPVLVMPNVVVGPNFLPCSYNITVAPGDSSGTATWTYDPNTMGSPPANAPAPGIQNINSIGNIGVYSTDDTYFTSPAQVQAAFRTVSFATMLNQAGTYNLQIFYSYVTNARGVYGQASANIQINVITTPGPPVLTAGANIACTANGATAAGTGVTVAEPYQITSASAGIKSGFFTGDMLTAITAGTNITVSYNASTGVLFLSGTDNQANYQQVLQSITYSSTSQNVTNNGTDLSRTISFTANDSTLTSTAVNNIINFADQAPVIVAGGTASYNKIFTPVAVAPGITVSDADDATLASATVSISTGFLIGDILASTSTGTNINANYDSNAGVLYLTGVDTKANYQKVLQSVTYMSTSDYPTFNAYTNDPSRTLSFVVNDGILSSAAATATVNIVATVQNVLANIPDQITVTAGSAPVAIMPNVIVGSDFANLSFTMTLTDDGYSNITDPATGAPETHLTWNYIPTIMGGLNQYYGYQQYITPGIQSTNSFSYFTVAYYNLPNTAQIQAMLRTVSFATTNNQPHTYTAVLSYYYTNAEIGDQEIAAAEVLINVVPPVAPVLTPGNNVTYTVNGAPAVLGTGITLTETDKVTSATVSISNGFLSGDVLVAATTGTNITSAYNTSTGVLTLSGTDNQANYQQVLRSITYSSTSQDATNAGADPSRTIAFTSNDGSLNGNTVTSTISIIQPPVISSGGSLSALSAIAGVSSGSIMFNVSGTNMQSGILVTAPAGFEVSADNNAFTPIVTIGTAGSISATPVYIRLAATDAVGNYSGNITLTSTGAAEVDVPVVSSTVSLPPTTVTSITAASSIPTNATTADYMVTFATALTTAPSKGDFNLTGTASGIINSITTTDNITYDVNVTSINGNGMLELAMTSGSDALPLISNVPFTGGAYVIDNTAPTALTLAYRSNNVNQLIAVAGNTVSLIFTTSETIQVPVVNIGGHVVTAINSGGNNWSANYVVTNSDPIGRLHFSITLTDLAGNSSNYDDVAAGDDIEVLNTDATLTNLAISNGTLGPGFSSAVTGYKVMVGNGLANINITPTVNDPNAKVSVNGTPAASGAAIDVPLMVGTNNILITVTAQDGNTQQTYSLTVTEVQSGNANLASVKTDAGLAQGTTVPSMLTETVINAVTSITVTPVAADAGASITVNNTTIGGRNPLSAKIALNQGVNNISIVVTAANGAVKTYTLTVTRAPEANDKLSALVVSNGTLSPAFGTATNYNDYVGNGAQLTLTPTTADPAATLTINGRPATSGTATAVPLVTGSNTVTIIVTAQNGLTKTYAIVVNQARSLNNNLFSLKTSGGLAKGKTVPVSLTETVSLSATNITVTPTLDDTTAAVMVNNIAVASGTASLSQPLQTGANTISIVVTAQNGSIKTYTLTVNRGNVPATDAIVYQPTAVSIQNFEPQLAGDGINVHQGVSPNGDGINDFLQIDNITNYPDNKISIMNRSGQLVYEAKGYDNATKVFDGHSNKNGQMQLPGTYFYELDYTANGVTKHKTGYLVLKY